MQTVKTAYGQVKQSWITVLAFIVAGVAIVATAGGILTAFGQTHRTFLSLSWEIVNIQGGGPYGHESVSMAAQGVGWTWCAWSSASEPTPQPPGSASPSAAAPWALGTEPLPGDRGTFGHLAARVSCSAAALPSARIAVRTFRR